MRTGMFALAAGLLSLRFLPALPHGYHLLGLGLLGFLLCLGRGRPLGLFLAGLAWACLSAQAALDDRLPPAYDGETFWLEGRIAGLPERDGALWRFELEDVRSRHAGLPSRLRLGWQGAPPLQAGERWRLAARLKRPHGMVNPQAFDYEAWLLARRVGATGTVKAGERLSPAGARGWRDEVRQALLRPAGHGREGALAALVVGDGAGLSEADWALLRDTGTVHLLVISGQHVSLLAGLLFALVMGLARLGWWPERVPWLPAACALALLGALAYGALAGFDVPVRRACLMIALVLLWRLRFRHLGVWLPWLAALVAVLLVEPLSVLQAGFWLSFAAVALLGLVLAGRLGAWSATAGLLRTQWAMSLGLLPPLLALGLPVSLSGPLANLLAVPWVGLGIVPLALLGALLLPLPGIGQALLWAAGWQLEGLFRVLAWIAGWHDAWQPAGVSPLAWGLGALGILVLLCPAGLPWRAFGLVLLLPLAGGGAPGPPSGQAQVWVFDVGQGLAVLVRTQGHALLYDAGPRQGGFDTGKRVIVPSLRALGVSRLDRLLLSHADQDHAGGARAVHRALRPVQVLGGDTPRLPAELAAMPCRNGDGWTWDGVRFQLLQSTLAADGNQRSCVLAVEAAGERVLLTGDIDRAAEWQLLQAGAPLRADWLLLPHHGSRSSSSAAFLEAVGAHTALLSRSRHNPFGHPHPDVLARLRARGMQVQDTAERGALRIDLGARRAATGLRSERRFWR